MSANKYSLDEEYQAKTDIIIEIDVHYSSEDDEVKVSFGQRNDVKSDDLLFRSAMQVEHALRQKIKKYAAALHDLEQSAGLDNTNLCGCEKGDHG